VELESSLVLIERAQSGDAAALNRLIDRYRPRIVRWASGRLPGYARDLTDTEDLVQDALVGTFRNFQTFQCRGEWALQGYLRRAVLNRIREELRRQKGRPRRDELRDEVAAQELSPLEAAMGAETFARYNAALDTLTEPEREAVIARLELGCSYKEIALLLDKSSEDAARMGVTRAIDIIRATRSTWRLDMEAFSGWRKPLRTALQSTGISRSRPPATTPNGAPSNSCGGWPI
jgi:RNA polymerase sigma factor (sigma-70 family)